MEKFAAIDAARKEFLKQSLETFSVQALAMTLKIPSHRLRNEMRRLGVVPPTKRLMGQTDAFATLKKEARVRQLARLKDRRRIKTLPVPNGTASKFAPEGHHHTVFPTKVKEVTDTSRILKSGNNNVKIGGAVLVGRLKGADIYTLTLEERATCPKTCQIYRGCYGNGMQHATRWKHGAVFERKLDEEVRELCETGALILIRLHVLGDFYSANYAEMWRYLLGKYDNLNIFGFTAWGPDTAIGSVVTSIRKDFGERFSVRHSGRCEEWGSFTIDFPTYKNRLGTAIVCPEQRAGTGDLFREDMHCGACGLCWSSKAPIVFMEH